MIMIIQKKYRVCFINEFWLSEYISDFRIVAII